MVNLVPKILIRYKPPLDKLRTTWILTLKLCIVLEYISKSKKMNFDDATILRYRDICDEISKIIVKNICFTKFSSKRVSTDIFLLKGELTYFPGF